MKIPEEPTDQIGLARAALLQARENSPTGELPKGALGTILTEYFGPTIPLKDAAELGLISFAIDRGVLTPRPGYTTELVPYPPRSGNVTFGWV
ncbi:hypothetical protein HY950_00985 [Candidatus Gottesmanbacteria bacterium]|nr:hypothetical protein [Candidatus Gottesmanbacteria bacterium]